ncbi:MAG: glucose-6-phosphate isomerase [Litorivicinaceae bacterium]
MREQLSILSSQWNQSLKSLFESDPNRGARYVAEGAGLRFDYSKHWVDQTVLDALISMLDECDFDTVRQQLFGGKRINFTENRSVFHPALRAKSTDEFLIDGVSVVTDVLTARGHAYAFAEDVRAGTCQGASSKTFTDVVNIGIGGSDLGPLMVSEALKPWIDGPKPHYVSNVDGAHLHDVLGELEPETTLFLIASKTFTTQETMHNAAKAQQWIADALGADAIPHHFAALSTNEEAVQAFGIAPERMFGFWDWVGGRYSVWSTIGLSLMISLGPDVFDRLLSGAREMDHHFKEAPPEANIPVLMALLGVWYRNGFGLETLAVLPYEQRLHRFSAYLQQMEMESNGKRVDRDGEPVPYDTCPVIWGEPGTNGQHAFFQLLHQGTLICPVDFIMSANPVNTDLESHQLLNANCLAQSESLAFGKGFEEVYRDMVDQGFAESEAKRLAPHRTFPGNRPSSTIMIEQLTPESLGALIAAYEHKVFTQGVIWNINSYDQWGVELGKAQCNALRPSFISGDATAFSSSTQEILRWLLKNTH